MNNPLNLSRHLLRAALIATLFPLLVMVALGLWQYQRDFQTVEELAGNESLTSARVVANFLDFLVDDTRTLLLRMARLAEQDRITFGMLKSEVDTQLQTEGLEVTDRRGTITMSTIGQQGRDVSKLPYFTAAKKGAKVAYSDVYYSPWLGQNVVMIAVPYRKNGAFGGVVMARLNLKVLNSLLSARLDDPRFRNTFVVDRKGNIISHYDFRMVEEGRNLAFMPPVMLALEDKSGWIKYDSPLDHSLRIGGYVPMPGTGWAVVASRKTGESVLRIEERLQYQLIFAGLAAVIAGMLAWWWGRRLSRPLEELAGTMRGAPALGFDPVATPTLAETRVTRDVAEYQTLAEVYNNLVKALMDRFNEVKALHEKMQSQNDELNAQNVELAWLSAEAQASNRLKSEFLANMSHELRTPLNSIIGYTELVLTDEGQDLDPLNRSNLEIVLKNARHLLALINDILDLSKVESGKMNLFSERIDPRQSLKAVLTTTQPLAHARGLKLEFIEHDAPEQVESDETKLRQIVLNLVSNAIKFTHEGGVQVTIEGRGPERWAVIVKDTGIGISPEDREMVFEEFRQVDASTTRQAGGTGLGLSIARKLARLLGGDLTLASEVGKGSTFTLELPRHLEASELPAPSLPVRALAPSHAGERVILAIDDDPVGLPLIAQKLRGTNFKVLPFDHPEAAIAKAREIKPFAVILDVKIRRQDDWRVLRELKADPRTADVPVVVLSFAENKAVAYTLGASAFLVKPVDQHQLEYVLDHLFAQSVREQMTQRRSLEAKE